MPRPSSTGDIPCCSCSAMLLLLLLLLLLVARMQWWFTTRASPKSHSFKEQSSFRRMLAGFRSLDGGEGGEGGREGGVSKRVGDKVNVYRSELAYTNTGREGGREGGREEGRTGG